jgi:flagellar assembly protein FliH
MPWRETITFSQPPREVVLVDTPAPKPAENDCEVRIREAEANGYARGRLEGEKTLSQQLLRQRAEMMEVHQGVVQSLRQMLPTLVRQAENELIAVAVEVARKLVVALPISAEMMAAVVREALEQVEQATELQIHLHEDDLALLSAMNSPLLAAGAGGDKISFHASKQVTRGGCLVETRFGILDARRETKLEQIKKSLGVGGSTGEENSDQPLEKS